MTCGPYRPVTLKFFDARIADVFTKASLVGTPTRGSLAKAALRVNVTVDGVDEVNAARLHVILKEKGTGEQVRSEKVALKGLEGVRTGGTRSLTGDEIVKAGEWSLFADIAAEEHYSARAVADTPLQAQMLPPLT